MNGFSVFLCLVTGIAAISATDYCSSAICSPGDTHIACGNSELFDISCPVDANMVTMTYTLQQLLVDAHNEKRNFIAGGYNAKLKAACRMATMQWDEELARLAAFNVKQCKMAHDKCHNTDAFIYSGQNIAWMGVSGSVVDATQMQQSIQMWYDEVKDSQQDYIDNYPSGYNGPSIGHFAVMVADRNNRVGCAASTYTPLGALNVTLLFTCNYATNNMENFPIYESCGTAGTSCTTGTNPTYPNLCSTSEVYVVNELYSILRL